MRTLPLEPGLSVMETRFAFFAPHANCLCLQHPFKIFAKTDGPDGAIVRTVLNELLSIITQWQKPRINKRLLSLLSSLVRSSTPRTSHYHGGE